MKKLLTVLLSVLMLCGLAACSKNEKTVTQNDTPTDVPTAKNDYASYMEADVDSEVEVLMSVQATQGYWEDNGQGKLTIYGEDDNGGYFVYNANVDKETAEKVVEGALIKVTGIKGEWSGEVEILDASVEVVGEGTVYEAKDVTEYVADTEALTSYMNQKVAIKGLTVSGIEVKDSESDPDIYITCQLGELVVSLCVENYLTSPDTEVYQTAINLTEGMIIDVEGFLYWYEGANPHITSITVAE